MAAVRKWNRSEVSIPESDLQSVTVVFRVEIDGKPQLFFQQITDIKTGLSRQDYIRVAEDAWRKAHPEHSDAVLQLEDFVIVSKAVPIESPRGATPYYPYPGR